MKKVIFFIALCFFASHSNAQRVVSFMFCKTKDRKIGTSVSLNYTNMRDEFQLIAGALGYSYNENSVTGYDFNVANVNSVIDKAEIRPDDIVFVYFSTHGAKSKYDSNIFPQLDVPDSLISAFNKHLIFLKKKPAVLITVIEACSGFLDITPQEAFVFEQFGNTDSNPQITPDQKENAKKLFSSACEIIITAGQPGKNTWATASGSMFTNCFLRALNEYLDGDPSQNSKLTWANVLDRAKTYTSDMTSQTSIHYWPVWKMRDCNTLTEQYLTNIETAEKRDVTFNVVSRKRLRLRNPYDVYLSITNKSGLKIDSVTYFMHKTMPHPTMSVTNGANNFYLSLAVWGTFPIKAKVYFQDGKVFELYKNIDFKNRETIEN
ncbi:pYEATS domain-containing protein [Mucilaginibacter sp. SJ]|uniref:pYEATS domain-containing protein n=1 Tax=Mucilaginibacter sp. SJ TaxID=3029053 RepID=UPI0023A9A7C0|nr:pYEATS domain-containing protein [Mucilaginibacter sp. SJ]WEA00713.1 caspase family protein [Mucilaginibacter sp. SJ]